MVGLGPMSNQPTNQIPAAFQSLTAKLDGLDLTADEEAAFGVLLHVVPADEVEGFGWDEGVAAFQVRGFNIGMPPAVVMSGGSTMLKTGLERFDA